MITPLSLTLRNPTHHLRSNAGRDSITRPSAPALQHATQVRDHWWWRPGWRVGRRFYTWHLTFEGQDTLHALVSSYQRHLAGVPGLDLVPQQWLHLTMQGVGFTDEIGDDEVDRIVTGARQRLARLPVAELTFHQPLLRPEAIVLPATPTTTVEAIRDAVRAAIAEARKIDVGQVPEADVRFIPHVTVAYISHEGAAQPLLEVLHSVNAAPATVRVPAASLIILDRDQHVYHWQEHSTVPLGTADN
jgi:2'-5' RNA ligase